MKVIGPQLQKLLESRQDMAVLLNTDGVIAYSNQNWIDFCCKQGLPTTLWKIGEDYIKSLENEDKFAEVQGIRDILNKKFFELSLLTSFQSSSETDEFPVKCHQFLLENGEYGAILYMQPTKNLSVEQLKTELLLESMLDAFCLLDSDMNFFHMSLKNESLLSTKQNEILGQNIWAAFPQLVGTAFYTNFTRAIRERITLQFKEFYSPLNSWFTVGVVPSALGGLAIYYQKTTGIHAIDEKYNENACTDYLTALPNRKKFEEKIEEMLQGESSFSLIYVNLDNFKHINTLHSHDKGDEVIQNVAKHLQRVLTSSEMVGRLDGDEFILLHKPLEKEGIDYFPKKVRDLFAQPILLKNSQSISVNASIGVSSFPQDSSNAAELIVFAETAMREAKKQIGTSYSVFHSGMGTDLARRLLIEKGLSGDLKALGFHFAVQPQINCLTGGLNGIEVLARWHHPDLGPISPVEFIGIAEETGTISYLTNHLIKEVFTFINTNKRYFQNFPKTAINITPSLLSSKIFFEELFRLKEKYRIQPDWIEIEITESVELTVSEITLQNLLACRTRGISIALDDFGTGFSMLAYLMDFPIDKIKLDKSFITKIGYDEKSEAVLKSLIQFVQNIGFELVAEGVETEQESAFLKNSGCLIHQGYFYEKPLPPDQFVEKYSQRKRITTRRLGDFLSNKKPGKHIL